MVNARPRTSTSTSGKDVIASLPTVFPAIFEQVQHTTANHRKNLVSLRKIQEQCALVTETTSAGQRLTGEKAFRSAFIDMVNRVLPVKKGVAVADRVVKFVASYVAYTTEQDLASRTEDQEDVETPYTRFVTRLLRHLLAGMEAKDKNVRFRVTLLVVAMVNGIGEMNEDLYLLLRETLLNRSRDKEAAVRVQAAIGLAKLQSGEDEDDLEEDEEPLSEVLLDLLRYDSAAEVRRAALFNLPRTPAFLPHILMRTRDVDPILRRTVFHGPLSAAALNADMLTVAQREQVVRNGLGDREPSVRKAASSMLGGWVDQVEGDLVEFLNRFDVGSGEVAEDALLSVFATRPEILDSVEFTDEYWTSLTPEKALLARVFVDHCITTKDESRLEDALPVVTALAFRIQDEYNSLVMSTNEENDDIPERAFIVGELLRMAVNLDYSDEIGRRKMFQLAREMISQANLPEDLIPKCMDILIKITNSEQDLIRVVVDVVTELRESEADEDADMPAGSELSTMGSPVRRQTMVGGAMIDDPEQAVRKALLDLRALLICISMLERITSNLQDVSVFHGLLHDLIVPAVQNTEEAALRDQGLICLGLTCMLDPTVAYQSLGLFVSQISASDDELRVKIVQILYDLLMVHDIPKLVSGTIGMEHLDDLLRGTVSLEQPEAQATACEGLAKLMLAGKVINPTLLQTLILVYFSPESADNQPLRQCLSYFLPVYCYSAPAHQRSLLSVTRDTFGLLVQLQAQAEAEDEPMLPLSQIGLMLVDWLDPQKAVIREGVEQDYTVHLDLGVEILKTVLTETRKGTRKALVSLLSKLNLPEPEDVEAWQVKSLQQLVRSIPVKRPLADASSRNAVARFETNIQKRYPEMLDDFDEDAFRAEGQTEGREAVQELFGFIDDVDERDPETMSEAGNTSRRGRGRGRGRSSETPETSSDEDDDEGEDDQRTPTVRRTMPVRQASAKKRQEAQVKVEEDDVESLIGSEVTQDEDEEEEDEEEEEEEEEDENAP